MSAPVTERMQIGRYTNLSLLGQGGMGAVYKAHDPSLDRTVALKVVLDQNPQFLARFQREAKAVARLSHPHIVQVYDFGQDEQGNPFFVMELVKGRALDAVLRESGPLPPTQVVALLRQAAEGLQAAHSAGIVHRDIKPQNMLLGDDAQLKLVDFGIARVEGVNEGITANNEALGTLHYMAPEVLSGQAADARTDVYSLGLVVFHLLTGKPPFTAPSAVGVAMKQINEPLPDLQKEAPATPASLRRLVERMTQKERDQRVQTCQEVAEQAARIAEELASTEQVTVSLPPITRRVVVIASGMGLACAALLVLVIVSVGNKRRRAAHESPHPVVTQAGGAGPAEPLPTATAAANEPASKEKDKGAAAARSRQTGPIRVTVLRFRNLGSLAGQLDPGEGIAEAITVALDGLRGKILLLERNQMEEVNLPELKLNQEGFMDKETAAKYGRVIGTEVLIQGSFQRIENTLRISARFTRVETGEVLDTATVTRPFTNAKDVFDIHDSVGELVREHLLKLLPRARG